MIETTRRLFLQKIAGLASLPILNHSRWLSATSAEHTGKSQELSSHEIRTLEITAHHLFPHDELPSDVYNELAVSLAIRAERNKAIFILIQSGIQSLDKLHNSLWVDLLREQQLDQLQQIEDTEFLQYMRNATIEFLYRDPRVWEKLEYAGPSIDFGGYINHGFNDIDWLP